MILPAKNHVFVIYDLATREARAIITDAEDSVKGYTADFRIEVPEGCIAVPVPAAIYNEGIKIKESAHALILKYAQKEFNRRMPRSHTVIAA